MSEVGYLLIFASRLLEVFGFLMALLFIFKGVALKHVFITAGLTVSGILISLFGFVSGKISAIQSFAIESVFAGFILALGFYAFKEKREEKLRPPKPPPKGTRCPVCMGFVKEDHYCVAREGKDLYYFDEEEHLKRFLEDLSEYKRLRKLNIKSIEDVFVKGWEGWKSAETYLSELK
jgi:YHS domain-containing protein